jgi:hypothetical protein
MNNGIEILKEIGAQKIYEQTHVSKEHVQAILHNSFEGLNKIQIIGFISILEREYKVDLTQTKESATKYFDELSIDNQHEHKEIFVAVREKKSNNITVYIVIISIILIIALYLNFKDAIPLQEKIDNTLIENAKEKIIKETNVSKQNKVLKIKESNTTITKEVKNPSIEPKKEAKEEQIKKIQKKDVKTLGIFSKSKVWLGYIDISNNKHYQTVVDHSLELNGSKDWLLLFGHNQIQIKIDDKIQERNDSIRYSYINSILTPINSEEFKKLNKGSKW